MSICDKSTSLSQDEKQALKSCVDKILQATQMAAAVDPQEAQATKDEDVTAFLQKHADDRRRQSEVLPAHLCPCHLFQVRSRLLISLENDSHSWKGARGYSYCSSKRARVYMF